MIRVTNLTFRYNSGSPDAVKNISFQIDKGEIFGFLGPSGAGKSTAQKILTGQLKTYSGSVIIAENEIKDAERSLYNRIGVAFEFPNLYEKLTAKENLKLFGSFYSRRLIDPDLLLKMVNLYEDRDTLVGSFSKGMKMRLNFARSIMHSPDLLFLDEPTSGLDPVNARMVKDIIRSLKDQGTTIFLTTHNMHDAETLCDRLALIDNGALVVSGSPSDLKLQFGIKQLKVILKQENIRKEIAFSLDGLGNNISFLEAIKSGNIETMHTCEASLEDIFVLVTGHNLTGFQTDSMKNAETI
jgi:fluoroquinolone transport system ATP-binding protein